MTQQTYAPWVKPIAERYEQERNEVARVARQIPDELWGMPSPLPGWSFKDVLAHLAGSQNLVKILRGVTEGRPVDPAIFAETDAQNAEQIEERRDRSVRELIAEIEETKGEVLELFAALSEEDKDRRQDDFPMSLSEGLSVYHHDEAHRADLTPALDSVML